MAPVAERGGIDVHAAPAGAGPSSVLAGRPRLKQVLLNLLRSPPRGPRPTSTGIEGTGLGPALSRQLVELMGGRIVVASAPGAGTTMSIELARAETHLAGGGAREAELAGQTPL